MLSSARRYDGGTLAEAKRLAVALRILCRSSRTQTGLLQSLDLVQTSIISTMTYGVGGPALLGVRYYAGVPTFFAPLGNATGTKPFDQWWNEVVLKDRDGAVLTREGIVLQVADKEGAHADPKVPAAMYNLAKGISAGVTVGAGQNVEYANDPRKPAIRQIAHELLLTFATGYVASAPRPGPGLTLGRFGLDNMPLEITRLIPMSID